MRNYLRLHESFVRQALAGEYGELSLSELGVFHDRQVRNMQHERLAHLAVTLAVATFFLLAVGFATLWPSWPVLAATILFTGLLGAYVVHYFRLENGVQRWYHLANLIDERMGHVSARYDEGRIRAWCETTSPAPGTEPGKVR